MIDDYQAILENYSALLGQLTKDKLGQLADFCSEDVLFKDPFNEHKGKQAYLAVLGDMFERLDNVQFQVYEVDVTEKGGYLRWHFAAKSAATGLIKVEGVSWIAIDQDGLICEHIDYWDGSEAMTGIPLLGGLISWIKRRAAYTG